MDSIPVGPVANSQSSPRRGVVAVIAFEGKLLVIRRSQHVRAPGRHCFPGGAIEPGESEGEAVVRELAEELALEARAVRRLWGSVTPWNVALSWWMAAIPPGSCPACNAAEVESCQWLSVEEIRDLPDLLESNLDFLAPWERGEFEIEGLGR